MTPAKKKGLEEVSDWEQSLKMIGACPICGKPYGPGRVKILKREQNARLTHIACASCGGYFMAMIMRLGKGTSTVGMITDLNFDDAKKLMAKAPISIDEAIEGYKFISTKFQTK